MKNTLFSLIMASLFVVVGCTTINRVVDGEKQGTTIESGRRAETVAYLSDLDNLMKKHVLSFTVPMNDQSYQPFVGAGMNYYRQLYPMWTDVNLVIFDSSIGRTVEVTTAISSTISTNPPFYSVEIPAVYRGSPDVRWNKRIDYTKYTSVAEFLLANAEDRVFSSISQARSFLNSADCNVSEEIKYAPRFYLIKLNTKAFDPNLKWAHSRNVNLQILFNRSIGSKRYETSPNDDTKLIWSPIVPKWSYEPMAVNEFATGDLSR